MIVMKFGGTSVGSAKNILSAAEIVQKSLKKKPIVVVSAIAGVTDSFIAVFREKKISKRMVEVDKVYKKHQSIIHELGLPTNLLDELFFEMKKAVLALHNDECDHKQRDAIVSFGERFSARIFSSVLVKHFNIRSEPRDAWDIGLITTSNYSNAEPLRSSYAKIKYHVKKLGNTVIIVTGFIGKTKDGNCTTLGRGGSDFTTAIIGSAVDAQEVQVWKEVDGVLSADPRVVDNARLVPSLDYEEMGELAYFGAKVLHPKTMLPVIEKKIPIRVLNTFKPSGAGTFISHPKSRNETHCPKVITLKKNTTLMYLRNAAFFDGNDLLVKIFSVFDKRGISVDFISMSVASFSCSFDSAHFSKDLKKEMEVFGDVDFTSGYSTVCIVGAGMNTAQVICDSSKALLGKRIPLKMISESASGKSVTFLLPETYSEKSVIALHAALIKKV